MIADVFGSAPGGRASAASISLDGQQIAETPTAHAWRVSGDLFRLPPAPSAALYVRWVAACYVLAPEMFAGVRPSWVADRLGLSRRAFYNARRWAARVAARPRGALPAQ